MSYSPNMTWLMLRAYAMPTSKCFPLLGTEQSDCVGANNERVIYFADLSGGDLSRSQRKVARTKFNETTRADTIVLDKIQCILSLHSGFILHNIQGSSMSSTQASEIVRKRFNVQQTRLNVRNLHLRYHLKVRFQYRNQTILACEVLPEQQ